MIESSTITAATMGTVAAGAATAANSLGVPPDVSYILAVVFMYVDLSRRVTKIETTIKECSESPTE